MNNHQETIEQNEINPVLYNNFLQEIQKNSQEDNMLLVKKTMEKLGINRETYVEGIEYVLTTKNMNLNKQEKEEIHLMLQMLQQNLTMGASLQTKEDTVENKLDTIFTRLINNSENARKNKRLKGTNQYDIYQKDIMEIRGLKDATKTIETPVTGKALQQITDQTQQIATYDFNHQGQINFIKETQNKADFLIIAYTLFLKTLCVNHYNRINQKQVENSSVKHTIAKLPAVIMRIFG